MGKPITIAGVESCSPKEIFKLAYTFCQVVVLCFWNNWILNMNCLLMRSLHLLAVVSIFKYLWTVMNKKDVN